MARPHKCTVDYFSHDVQHKKTIYTLQVKWGNDGYAFWFKLLELLGATEGHVYDCNNPAAWEYLTAYTRVNGVIADNILDVLANLDAIDPELWRDRIIWSQNFVDRLADVYHRRKVPKPERPEKGLMSTLTPLEPNKCQPKPLGDRIPSDVNPQSKVKERKEYKEPTDTPPLSPPPDPPHEKKNGKHYSQKMCGADFTSIEALCQKLLDLNCAEKKINPHQIVQRLINESIHPRAVIQAFQEMIDRWVSIENPWGYIRRIIGKLNYRAQEEARIQESKNVSRLWDDFSKTLPKSVIPFFDMPDAATPENERERLALLRRQCAALKDI